MANFLFVLSRDDNQAATRCFQFAQIAHSKGHDVNLFLVDDGVFWADSGRDLDTKIRKRRPGIAPMSICRIWLKTKSPLASEFRVPMLVRSTSQTFFRIWPWMADPI